MDAAAVYQELLKINTTLGSLATDCRNTNCMIVQHIEDDKQMAADIQTLKLSAASQRGGAKVVVLLATAIGSVFGASASAWLVSHFGVTHPG